MKRHRSTYTGERGFIALTSTLILCAVLVLLVYSTSASGFYARFDAMSGEFKRISLGLSESCTNAALLKISQDYNYTPPFGGDIVNVGPDRCIIKSVTYSGQVFDTSVPPKELKKTATIQTIAQYPVFGGSWSTTRITATVSNPTETTTQPAPVCVLQATPSTIQAGKPITVQWSASSNTTEFNIISTSHPAPSPVISNPSEAQSGTRTFTIASPGDVQFTGQAKSNAGVLSEYCSQTVTVTAPPPAPACADTMMVFDRSGSLNSTDRTNVKSAANQLIDLYATVPTLYPGFSPKIGAGFFGARSNGNSAEIPTDSPNNGQLSNFYPALKTTVANLMDSASGQNGSNLGAGAKIVYDEYFSGRATDGFKHVLIFVSDGEPNVATPDTTCSTTNATDSFWCRADFLKLNGVEIFTIQYTHQSNLATAATARALLAKTATGEVLYSGHQKGAQDNSLVTTDTSWKYPSAVHVPNNWTSPTNAYATDSTYTTDIQTGHQQGFASFNITAIPSGSTITGIEANVSGLLTANLSGSNSSPIFPTAEGAFTAWLLQSTSTKAKAVLVDEGSTDPANGGYITTASANAGQTFAFPGVSIPVGATINSVTVSAVARFSGGAAAPQISLRTERGVGTQVDGPTNTVSNVSPYQTYSWTMPNNPFTSAAWDVADVTSWGTTRFGVVKTNSSGTVRVTQLYVTVNYTAPVQASCTVGVDLSWNNGSNWTSSKNVTLTGSESVLVPTGNSATDTWGRTWNANNDFSNGNLVMRLTNNTCTGSTLANVNSVSLKVHYSGLDFNAENNDGDAFFVIPDVSNPSSIKNIFETIGNKVCPAAAAACANGIDDDGDGTTDSNDASCHLGDTLSGPYVATDNDEWTAPALPPAPTQPLPPATISIGSWDEIISPNP